MTSTGVHGGESVAPEADVLALVRGPLEKVIGKPATDAVYNLRAQRDALEAEVERLREALGYIAAPDDLLDANEGAFNVHAARRMQAQAQAALSGSSTGGSDA